MLQRRQYLAVDGVRQVQVHRIRVTSISDDIPPREHHAGQFVLSLTEGGLQHLGLLVADNQVPGPWLRCL